MQAQFWPILTPDVTDKFSVEDLSEKNPNYSFDDQHMREEVADTIVKFCKETKLNANYRNIFSVIDGNQTTGLEIKVQISDNPDITTNKRYPLHYKIQITKADEENGKVIYSDYRAPQSAKNLITEIKRGAIELLSYDAAEARRAEAKALASK